MDSDIEGVDSSGFEWISISGEWIRVDFCTKTVDSDIEGVDSSGFGWISI